MISAAYESTGNHFLVINTNTHGGQVLDDGVTRNDRAVVCNLP